MVHECLKRRWRVALAKEHHRRFIEPVRSSESGLPLVGLLNPNIVVSPSDIEFRKVVRVFERIDEVGDTRKGVSILDSMRIDVTVVLTRAERSILLRNKEEGGRLRGLRREDLSFFEVLIDEHFQGFHLLGIERIVLRSSRDERVVEFDSMVKGSMGRKGYFRLLEHICEICKFGG